MPDRPDLPDRLAATGGGRVLRVATVAAITYNPTRVALDDAASPPVQCLDSYRPKVGDVVVWVPTPGDGGLVLGTNQATTRPHLRVQRVASLSHATGTEVDLVWDSLVEDVPGGHITTPSATITVQRAGLYRVTAAAQFTSGAGGQNRLASLRYAVFNGGAWGRLDGSINNTISIGAGAISTCPVAYVIRLSVGNQLRFSCYHNATGSLDVAGSWLHMEWIAP